MRKFASTFAFALALSMPLTGIALGEQASTTTTTVVKEPTGQLVITDPGTRSFRIGSEPKVYVAPPAVDLATLSGKDVKVYMGADGTVTRVTETTTVKED